MNFTDAINAINDAERTVRAADSVASRVEDLKRELRDFDARTHEWKK